MSGYTWRVWKNNRLVGYVIAAGEWQAISMAEKQFGKYNMFVERVVVTSAP